MNACLSKLCVPGASPPLPEPPSPLTAAVPAKETRDGERGSSGVLARIPPREAVGSLRKRLRSAVPEDGGDAKRIKDLGNGGDPDPVLLDDGGQFQHARAEPESLLFSYQPSGAASDMVLGPFGSVQPMSPFKLDGVKDKIFLSHSGEEEDFVEQLCVDLERKGYFFPFFDQRYHSLPKGEYFVPLIKEAARLCHVAVIVLSEGFLRSKWPMIELAEFYDAQQGVRGSRMKLNLLPLFFKLSVNEVRDEDRWMPFWKKHAAADSRIDLSKWSAAVKALCKSTGCVFGKDAPSEVSYRKCVVKSVFKLSPPDLLFGSSKSMVGYGRMCEAMSRQFVEDTTVGARVLGIYGMAGVGKTVLAKALHDHFYEEFLGKVCYVDMRHGSRAGRQKCMLETLCDVEKKDLERLGVDVGKGMTGMGRYMKREPVFLILDNVTHDVHSLNEVRDYLTVGFHPESRIVITSSSKAILQEMFPNMKSYSPMPTLTDEEARTLFLNRAAPLKVISEMTKEEQNILGMCTRKCWFYSENGGSYHPVALGALADFFHRLVRSKGNELMVWKDYLEKEMDLVKDVLRSSKDLFGVLDVQFSTFEFSTKLLFLDIALFHREEFEDSGVGIYEICNRLCRLHGVSLRIIRNRLKNLLDASMVEIISYGSSLDSDRETRISVPELYVEFAEWYATDQRVGALDNAWGVYEPGGVNLTFDLWANRHWCNLIRLRVRDSSLASAGFLARKEEQKMSKLVMLQLYNCHDLRKLSLEGFNYLREVQLRSLPDLVTISVSNSSSSDDYVGIYHSLQRMELEDLPSLVHMPDLRPCTSLHTLRLTSGRRLVELEGVHCSFLEKVLIYLYPIYFEKFLALKC